MVLTLLPGFLIAEEKGLQRVNYTFRADNLNTALYTFFNFDCMDGWAEKN